MPGHQPRVPQRVPALLGQLAHDRGVATPRLVEQQHIDVRSRAELSAGVGTERDERDGHRRRERAEQALQGLVEDARHRAAERRTT
ncbi:MAG: hypothetical protein KatS3mg010_2126 [Acidimicrobiia bacterium]|nr:MAG: hypothetical protein KatS3mg010_2126 [Acidimicrobiia bacterium]